MTVIQRFKTFSEEKSAKNILILIEINKYSMPFYLEVSKSG
jgi:hypothetical protein